MNEDKDISEVLVGLMESLSIRNTPAGVPNAPVGAETAVLDSSDVDLRKFTEDHIYGLLSRESLTREQISLLSALVGAL